MSSSDTGAWQPPRIAHVLIVVTTLAAVASLAVAADVVFTTAIGGAGAAAAAAAFWLLHRDRYRPAALAGASVLLLPVCAAVVTATVATVLLRYTIIFPVESLSDIPAPALKIVATMLLVDCLAIATFGALSRGRILDEASVLAAVKLLAKLTVAPLITGVSLGVLTVLNSPQVPPTVDLLRAFTRGLDAIWSVLVTPPAPTGRLSAVTTWGPIEQTALPSFLFLLALGMFGVRLVLSSLPIFALLEAGLDTDHSRFAERLNTVESKLASTAPLIGILGLPIGAGIPVGLTAAPVDPTIAAPVYALATTEWLRVSFLAMFGVGVTCTVTVSLLRRLVRRSNAKMVGDYAPIAAGAGVVLIAYTVAPTLLPAIVSQVASLLSDLGPLFSELANGVIDFYGPGLILTTLTVGLLIATATLLFGLATAFAVGLLDADTAGTTLTGVGLVGSAGFGTVLDVSLPVLALIIVAGLAVGDLGRYTNGLGLEMGRSASSGKALLGRVGFLTAVSVLAVGVTVGTHAQFAGEFATPVPATVPLVGAVSGTLLLALLLWLR